MAASTSNFTAWALLAQMAFGDCESDSVKRGIAYLLSVQQEDGFWWHRSHNAPGFPRIFYLKYHGYTAYFAVGARALSAAGGAAAARASPRPVRRRSRQRPRFSPER